MSSKLHTKSLEVGTLKPGHKIELAKVYVLVKAIHRAEKEGPTIDDDVLLLELVGDCGPFKGRKTRITVSSKAKMTVVLRNPFRKLWDKIRDILAWRMP